MVLMAKLNDKIKNVRGGNGGCKIIDPVDLLNEHVD